MRIRPSPPARPYPILTPPVNPDHNRNRDHPGHLTRASNQTISITTSFIHSFFLPVIHILGYQQYHQARFMRALASHHAIKQSIIITGPSSHVPINNQTILSGPTRNKGHDHQNFISITYTPQPTRLIPTSHFQSQSMPRTSLLTQGRPQHHSFSATINQTLINVIYITNPSQLGIKIPHSQSYAIISQTYPIKGHHDQTTHSFHSNSSQELCHLNLCSNNNLQLHLHTRRIRFSP